MTTFHLDKVHLGTNGPLVGQQGFGAMGINTSYYGSTDETEARATLEQALDLGITLFDTASSYGGGANELFLAPFLAAHRDEVVIATKFGIEYGTRRVSNEPGFIRTTMDASLRRLGVDHVDVFYMHRRDVNVPIEQTVGVMAELVAAGKARYLGLSEVTADELRAAAAVHPITAVQSEWSLFSRDIEARVVPAAAELGAALVPYSPLGRGVLTGALSTQNMEANDVRRAMPRFADDNEQANHDLLAPLREVAAAHDATMAQTALAWLYAQGDVFGLPVVPIPGTRSRTRVIENAGGARIDLTAGERARLDPLAAQVAGDRFGDMSFVSAGRE